VRDIALGCRVVMVQRDVIDGFIALLQRRHLPFGEMLVVVGSSGENGLSRIVYPLDHLRYFMGPDAKADGILLPRTDLPVAVHFIAQVPGPDRERLGMAVFLPQVGPVSTALVPGILDQVGRVVYVACPEVDGIHRLRVGAHRPFDVLVMADDIRLDLEPRQVECDPAVFTGSYRSLPVPSGYDVASRQPDSRQ